MGEDIPGYTVLLIFRKGAARPTDRCKALAQPEHYRQAQFIVGSPLVRRHFGTPYVTLPALANLGSRGYAGRKMLQRLHPPGFVSPCLPAVARTPPEGPLWAYEIKHDGFRFLCRRDGDRVRIFSRNARDWADGVPLIVEVMRALPVDSALIDGEGVVCDASGVTDFERLRAALARGGSRQASLNARG